MVVANPVDILTYTAARLSGFPENRVFGSGTVLDTARLKYLLGEHLGVDNRSVHAFMIGEHGDTEIAAWSSANVLYQEEYIKTNKWDFKVPLELFIKMER